MKDLLFMGLFGIALWVFVRIIEKKPILPWGKPKENFDDEPTQKLNVKKNKKTKNGAPVGESETELFKSLFREIKEINNHMIRHRDNKFVLIAEVQPANYFLQSQDEQESMDAAEEKYYATLDSQTVIYLQNRYIDLSEPIEKMQKEMKEQDDLPPAAVQYGTDMINDLIQWQRAMPRFETKRYLLFVYQVDAKNITADDKEELEEKIQEKAFAELYRRFNAAKSALRKSKKEVEMLTREGIVELLYYTFNRRKALKNKFKHIKEQEMLALFVTADQDSRRIEMVKERIDDEFARKDQEAEKTAG